MEEEEMSEEGIRSRGGEGLKAKLLLPDDPSILTAEDIVVCLVLSVRSFCPIKPHCSEARAVPAHIINLGFASSTACYF